jgi:hypothetical protein
LTKKERSLLTKSSIDDAFLIDWLKDKKETIDFINFKQPPTAPKPSDQLVNELQMRRDDLIAEISHLPASLNKTEKGANLLKIWKLLLGNAIVYLKLLDNREKYHDAEDFGVERLYKFFETFYEFEGVLYGADDYYRDHVSHMLRVFLLGEYLISTELKFENIIVGNENISKKISSSEKEAMWCIIALTHDLGYALETVPDINKKVRTMLEQFGNINFQEIVPDYQIQPLHKFILQFISSDLREIKISKEKEPIKTIFLNHIQSKYFLKFSGAFERQSHGIISCIVNMRNLVFFLESDYSLDFNKPLDDDEAKQFLIRSNILRAIASHDCDEIYYLTLPQFPFLLTLFDEMQEWDRPRLKDAFRKSPKSSLRVIKFNQKEVEFEIKFTFTDSHSTEEEKRMEEDIKGYFERKSKKIKKILRSAVDGKRRNLTLSFNVVDTISDIKKYQIIHKNPEDVKISTP